MPNGSDSPLDAPAGRAKARGRTLLFRSLQWAVSLAGFAYVVHLVDAHALAAAVRRVPWSAFALVLILIYANFGVATLRWRLLFSAFGASAPPRLLQLAKLYLMGLFYNTYLPGGVGGDVARGVASRAAFGQDGTASAVAIVLVERVMGMSALLLLTAAATLLHPLPGVSASWLLSVLGLCAATAAVVGLLVTRWLSSLPFVPKGLAAWLVRLPRPQRFLPLLATLPLSLGCQLLGAYCGYVFVVALVPTARLVDAFVIVPLAMASAFVPVTVSGAGLRETIFVELYRTVGVPSSYALAASLLLWFSQALVAASGGLWALFAPVTLTPASEQVNAPHHGSEPANAGEDQRG